MIRPDYTRDIFNTVWDQSNYSEVNKMKIGITHIKKISSEIYSTIKCEEQRVDCSIVLLRPEKLLCNYILSRMQGFADTYFGGDEKLGEILCRLKKVARRAALLGRRFDASQGTTKSPASDNVFFSSTSLEERYLM